MRRESVMNHAILKFWKPNARILSVLLVAWVSIDLVASLSARSQSGEKQTAIRVGVYNDAHVDRLALYDAEHQVAGLFAEAGVKITWLDYSHQQRRARCQPEDSSADFFLRIASAFGTIPQNSGTDALGQSMIPPTGYGYVPCGTASVFYDRVIAFASVWAPNSREILGDVLAHELGHLLLGPLHSPQGIMKAFWTFDDLDLARRGRLRFTKEQLAMLQVTTRSLPRSSSTIATAQR
jgi:hypothetical protein